MDVLRSSGVGIIQMPCPELHCLGLDRGNVHGSSVAVVEENTRIRKALHQPSSNQRIKQLAHHIVAQMIEYRKNGLAIQGIIGINRSPSCGVDTTSKDNQEVHGEGVFMEALRHELDEHAFSVKFVGIKAFETDKAVLTVKNLLGSG
jgi:predicted secreted protein